MAQQNEPTGQIYDKKGRPILVGDVLRVFHFVSYLRREKRYMYKYVSSLHESEKALLVSHLIPSEKSEWIILLNGEVLDHVEIVQGYGGVRNGRDFTDRKKLERR